MIRMENGARLRKEVLEALPGKYVLKDAGYFWPGLGHPRVVSRVSGTRVYVDRPATEWDEGLGRHRLVDGERAPDGHVSLSSVECVCDTMEEADAVLAASDESRRRWARMEREAKDAFMESLRKAGAGHGTEERE